MSATILKLLKMKYMKDLSVIRATKVLVKQLKVDQWPTRLRHLSQFFNFGATLDSMLRDRLILGTKDEKAQAK